MTWYVFQTPPIKEHVAKREFDDIGVEAWYPVRIEWVTIPNSRRKRKSVRAVVGRYIFANLPDPDWQLIKDRVRHARIIISNERFMAFSDDDLKRMAQMPARIEAMMIEEAEAKRIKPGDKVLHPLFDGWAVDVTAIKGNRAWLDVPMGGKVETDVAQLRKAG